MVQQPGTLAALDVGNHRVLALIGELDDERRVVIKGVGLAPSEGMRAGQIVHLKPAVRSIRTAIEEAELMAKVPAERVIASTAGVFVHGRLTRAQVNLGNREREVGLKDLEALYEAARRQPLPPGHTVLNVVAPAYALDDQEGILDPQGMVGKRLSIDAFVLGCQESPLKTLEKAVNEAGVEVEEFLFSPVAAAAATLTDDERRLGSILIDVGYGTTTYAAFAGDRLLVAGCLPVGSNKINDDLVHRFQTTAAGGETVKRTAGSVLLSDVGEEETLSVPTIDGRGSHVVLRREVCKTIRIRMQETLELVANEVWRQIPQDAPCTGVVLCGGGAHLDGLAALAEEVFVKRARLGEMEGVVDSTALLASSELPSRSPAVAVGLLVHARELVVQGGPAGLPGSRRSGGLMSRLKRLMRTRQGGGA